MAYDVGMMNTTIPTPSQLGRTIPEFFPLPARGLDPYFGISRSSYYDLENRRLLRLVRIRKPGNIRGKVLVPYPAVMELMQRFTAESDAQGKGRE